MYLEHVAIYCSDLGRSEKFYVAGFGFERTRSYQTDRFKTAFLRGESGALLQLREPVSIEPAEPESGLDHLGIVVEDIDRAFEHVVERTDCPIIERPRPARKGVAVAFVEDPDGLHVELIERNAT